MMTILMIGFTLFFMSEVARADSALGRCGQISDRDLQEKIDCIKARLEAMRRVAAFQKRYGITPELLKSGVLTTKEKSAANVLDFCFKRHEDPSERADCVEDIERRLLREEDA
jgi:hypothetical protein